jgi:hypothetical protein
MEFFVFVGRVSGQRPQAATSRSPMARQASTKVANPIATQASNMAVIAKHSTDFYHVNAPPRRPASCRERLYICRICTGTHETRRCRYLFCLKPPCQFDQLCAAFARNFDRKNKKNMMPVRTTGTGHTTMANHPTATAKIPEGTPVRRVNCGRRAKGPRRWHIAYRTRA